MLSDIDTFNKWNLLTAWLIDRVTLIGTPIYATYHAFGSDDKDQTKKIQRARNIRCYVYGSESHLLKKGGFVSQKGK
jgi:hypothetical protein